MNNLKSLRPKTKEVLLLLSELQVMKSFTFVGGSALAVHLNHRLSEDLDFFSSEPELDTKNILEQINQLKVADYKIINNSKNQLDLFINNIKVTFLQTTGRNLTKRRSLSGLLALHQFIYFVP